MTFALRQALAWPFHKRACRIAARWARTTTHCDPDRFITSYRRMRTHANRWWRIADRIEGR